MKNVILFFTDQQRYDTISALGNNIIKTPALDRLVKSGISYTHAYTPSPVCVPARLSMLTGKYAHETGCTVNSTMPDGHKSVMHILKENGYQTHGVGKMHFTFKDDKFFGFDSRDVSEEIGDGSPDDFRDYLDENGYGHVKDKHGVRGEMYYIPQPSQLPHEHHNSTWVANKTIDYLENRNKEKPFFLMSSFIKPHPPFEAPVPFNKLYRSYDMPLPKFSENDEDLYTYFNVKQNRYKGRDKGTDLNLLRTMKAYYYATISHVDFNLGRILDYLEENNLMDDTLIIFTSDHGEMLGDYNCFGKRCFYDSAARVPMILKVPGEKGNVKCSHNASLIDILPTILDYTSIKTNQTTKGVSLFDLLDEKYSNRAIVSQYGSLDLGTYMIKKGSKKYIYSAPDEKEWFFDHDVDETECKNLAIEPKYSDIVKELKSLLITQLKNDGLTHIIKGNEFKKYGKKVPFTHEDEGYLFQDSEGSLPDLKGYTK